MNYTNGTVDRGNGTLLINQIQQWTILTGFKVAVLVISVTLNAGVLIFYALKPSCVTSFGIYLIALFISNLVYQCASRGLVIGQEVSPAWRMDDSSCIFLVYTTKVVSELPVICHVLISVNRFWAFRYPVSYRNHHNMKMAICICLCALLYVNTVSLSGFLTDFLNYYHPEHNNRDCQRYSGSMPIWPQIQNTLDRYVPLFATIYLYIYLIVKRYQKRSSKLRPRDESSEKRIPASATGTRVLPMPAHSDMSNLNLVMARTAKYQREIVKPSLILTLSSISVLVCWLPFDVYFLVRYLVHTLPSDTYFDICSFLYSLQGMLDPLMFFVCLRRSARFRSGE